MSPLTFRRAARRFHDVLVLVLVLVLVIVLGPVLVLDPVLVGSELASVGMGVTTDKCASINPRQTPAQTTRGIVQHYHRARRAP